MSQDKQSNEPLQYFQNLIPGTQDSAFMQHYKEECLENEEEHSVRWNLVANFPPVLSFFEQQKRDFYNKRAGNCEQFCCSGFSISYDLFGKASSYQTDNYLYSAGTGKYYEGGVQSIRTQMEDDIRQATFGSNAQNQLIVGLQQFNTAIEQKGNNLEITQNNAPQNSSLNPFKTVPKPDGK